MSSDPESTMSDWTDNTEELLIKWKNQVEKLALIHQNSGYIIKSRFYRLAIPSILLPFIMTFISQIIAPTNNAECSKLPQIKFSKM